MKYVKEHGGISIFVYNDFNIKDMKSIKGKDAVSFYTEANFSRNGELYNYIKQLCKIK